MDENITLTENTAPPVTQQQNVTPQQNEIKLVDVPIRDENTALNVMVSFLSLAQKRGTFSIDESAKIWECIKMFQKA